MHAFRNVEKLAREGSYFIVPLSTHFIEILWGGPFPRKIFCTLKSGQIKGLSGINTEPNLTFKGLLES